MSTKEKILAKLRAERLELISLGHMNLELSTKIEDIEMQIVEIEGEDTFRSHELIDNQNFIEDDGSLGEIEDESFGDNNYGYVSENFHDPTLDY